MQKRSFETVVADHGPTVLRVCLAVLGPTEADDAWSETFVSAMTAAYRGCCEISLASG